jgi:hypothetical protein
MIAVADRLAFDAVDVSAGGAANRLKEEDPVEVKIGVQHAPRELSLESAQSPAEVEQAVTEAMAKDGVLSLTDEKGRRVIIPVSKVAYVEIAESSNRPFGFTTR